MKRKDDTGSRSRKKTAEKPAGRRRSKWKWILFCILLLILFGIILIIACNLLIYFSSRSSVFSKEQAESCEKADCILVLGALVRSDGSLSTALKDRVDCAIDLYQQGLSDVIFLTGDGANEGYNEPEAMKRYCLNHGVPEEAIVCDPYGLSTLESMERAASEFHYRSVLVVTQEYHQYRSVWLATKMGMTAQGVSCDEHYLLPMNYLREIAARVAAVFRIAFR